MADENTVEEKKAKKERNVWKLSTVAMLVILGIVLVYNTITPTGMVTDGTTGMLTADEAGQKAIAYVNKNLIQTGSVSMVSVEEVSGLYVVTTSYQGQMIPIYVTKDGKNLFLSPPTDMTQEVPAQEQPQEFDAPDKEKTEAELFVMSFCPYGVQAENTMKPVVDLLGDKADIKVRFIAGVQGNDVGSISSLHGTPEAEEDLRQLCIQKNYPDKFWDYLMDINENCYPIYRDAEALDSCWKEAAEKLGLDVTEIETCAYGEEGIGLLRADEALTDTYGVSGSPTLIINGERYSGSRDPEAFKNAICSGFINPPDECSETLSGTGGTASGAC